MHWLVHLDIIVLGAMLAYAIVVSIRSSHRFYVCRHACRALLSQLAEARSIDQGSFDQLLQTNTPFAGLPRDPASQVLAAGVTAFALASPSRKFGLQSAKAAMHKSRRAIIAAFGYEADRMAEITSLAPFLALAGTCIGIFGAFRGIGMERHAAIAMMEYYIAISLITTATGLLVVIPVVCLHHYLRTCLGKCEADLTEVARATLLSLSASSDRCPSEAALSSTTTEFFVRHSAVAKKFALGPRLSLVPSFALVAATVLMLIDLGFTVVRSGEPVGLDVRVLRTNESVPAATFGAEGTLVDLPNSPVGTSRVLYVDFTKVAMSDLNRFMHARAKLTPNGTVYVHAAGDVSWEEVATAIDASEVMGGGVVLLTNRPLSQSNRKFPGDVH